MKVITPVLLVLLVLSGAVVGDLANVGESAKSIAEGLLSRAGIVRKDPDHGDDHSGERSHAGESGSGGRPSDERRQTRVEDDGHDEERGHGGEDGHKGDEDHDGDHEEGSVRLNAAQVALAEIQSILVTIGDQHLEITLTGEIQMNRDRLVSVVPRVPGVARSVHSFLGDRVEDGTIMAIVESRSLADAKTEYVVARERTKLARTKLEREERLWKKRISSEEAYLDARAALAETRIQERAANQKLRALGVPPADLKKLAQEAGESYTRYEILAPFAGTVIEKQITMGASVHEEEAVYKIANLDSVWVIASVYEKDIPRVNKGQIASVITSAYPDRSFPGRVSWIADTVDEETRTLKIRVEVENTDRRLKPGMFARVNVVVGSRANVFAVPTSAVRRQRGEDIVFIDEGEGRFARREIELGQRSGDTIEVVSGLSAGERVVVAGSFLLKSELEKESFGGGHGH